jgi:hypothetical protein
MRLAALVGMLHAAFDPDEAMADVAALCGHDRYQASAGIGAAAAYVASRAQEAGLAGVEVLEFPGGASFGAFRGPLGWTPVCAALTLGAEVVLRYPEQPYGLAAYSAATPPGGRVGPLLRWSAVRDGADPAGALVVLDEPALVAELTRGGALGFVADPLGARADRLPDQVGRLELPPGSPLVAFSVAAGTLARLLSAADRGSAARVLVELGPPATMPVVTGHTRSSTAGELLLSAHLCHPRPSANDNASGVAALLGLARCWPPVGGPAVRFVWGPEFVGLSAYLAARPAAPIAAVNIDMAGEDQHRCGGPLVIERTPDELPSYLSALAERCAALLPPAGRSYSGAVGSDTWAWRSTPYVGASDHALLAAVGCPAVGLGHWPDRFNHTSADTLDKVNPAELRRTATIAGATLACTAAVLAGDQDLSVDLADTTVAWAARHLAAALPGAEPPPAPAPTPVPTPVPVPTSVSVPTGAVPGAVPGAVAGSGEVFDPWAREAAERRMAHRGAVARGALDSLAHLDVSTKHLADKLIWLPDAIEPPDIAGPVPTWDGPVNLRALTEAATPDDQTWLAARLAEDRGGGYARMLALCRALDGRRDTRAAAWWAALAAELPIPADFAERFFAVLARAGWTHPGRHDQKEGTD